MTCFIQDMKIRIKFDLAAEEVLSGLDTVNQLWTRVPYHSTDKFPTCQSPACECLAITVSSTQMFYTWSVQNA